MTSENASAETVSLFTFFFPQHMVPATCKLVNVPFFLQSSSVCKSFDLLTSLQDIGLPKTSGLLLSLGPAFAHVLLLGCLLFLGIALLSRSPVQPQAHLLRINTPTKTCPRPIPLLVFVSYHRTVCRQTGKRDRSIVVA